MMVRTDTSAPARETVFGIMAFHDVAPSIQEICDAGKDGAGGWVINLPGWKLNPQELQEGLLQVCVACCAWVGMTETKVTPAQRSNASRAVRRTILKSIYISNIR